MTSRYIYVLFFLLIYCNTWAQKITFISSKDSTIIHRIAAQAFDMDNKIVGEYKSDENGVVDLTSVLNGNIVEIFVTGFESRTFVKTN